MTDAETQLDGFIAKFAPDNQALIRECRAYMRGRLPSYHELVYDNYNFFVIGYCPGERPSDAILSLAANAKGMTLFFLRGVALADPNGLLQGEGNAVRSIRLPDCTRQDDAQVDALIERAVLQGKLPEPGIESKLIIRSVSAKQRPRR